MAWVIIASKNKAHNKQPKYTHQLKAKIPIPKYEGTFYLFNKFQFHLDKNQSALIMLARF